jgi:hypothetical protein
MFRQVYPPNVVEEARITTGIRLGTRCYSVFNLTLLSLLIGRGSDNLHTKNDFLTLNPTKLRVIGNVPTKDQNNDNVLHRQFCARACRQ